MEKDFDIENFEILDDMYETDPDDNTVYPNHELERWEDFCLIPATPERISFIKKERNKVLERLKGKTK